MKRRRRLLLQSVAAAVAPLPALAPALTIESGPTDPLQRQETLRALVDTLIPADEAPAASALGVDRALLQDASRNADYRQMLENGALWLDRTARALGAKSFAAAPGAQRIAIVKQAENSPARSAPRLLFERIRYDAMRHYYSQPSAWSSLGYGGPPQPAGFMDFESPPPSPRS